MNILLTGSNGFIGKNLKEYLKDKYCVLSPRSFELNLCDSLCVEKYFNSNRIDFIIHCATNGGKRGVADELNTFQNNLSMVNNILLFKDKNTKLITFGSGAMYDKSRNLHKVKEEDIGKFTPQDLYGLSKLEIAKIAKNRDDMLCLNIFACYGYNELESRFPSYAIRQNMIKRPIEINQNVVFDYLFSEDMVQIVEYFIQNWSCDRIINITPSKSIDLIEIAKIINNISDYKSEIIVKNPKLNNEYTGDNTNLLKNIKDFKFTDMEIGLKKLYKFMEMENEKQYI